MSVLNWASGCVVAVALSACAAGNLRTTNVETDRNGLSWAVVHTADPARGLGIAQKLSQPVLMLSDDHDPQARWLIAVVRAPYGSVTDKLSSLVSKRYGIASANDRTDSIQEIWDPGTPASIPDYVAELRSKGIPTNPSIGQTLIESKPFNQTALTDAISRLHIRAIDGNALFGVPSTVVILTRHDRYTSFTSMPPHIVLPRHLSLEGWVVTKDDFLLLSEAREDLGSPPWQLSASPYLNQYRYAIVRGGDWLRRE